MKIEMVFDYCLEEKLTDEELVFLEHQRRSTRLTTCARSTILGGVIEEFHRTDSGLYWYSLKNRVYPLQQRLVFYRLHNGLVEQTVSYKEPYQPVGVQGRLWRYTEGENVYDALSFVSTADVISDDGGPDVITLS